MRIGLAEKTVQMALGQAAVYSDRNSSPSKVRTPFEEVVSQLLYNSITFDLIGSMLKSSYTFVPFIFSILTYSAVLVAYYHIGFTRFCIYFFNILSSN
jgi:hypothetical protein